MKRFLLVSAALFIALSLVLSIVPFGFAQKVPDPFQYNSPREYQRTTGKKITKYDEAPMLAELVKAGKLPPIEKRLPKEPIVIVPVEEVGQYGGEARALGGGDSYGEGEAFVGWEGILRVTPEGKVIPNIVRY